MDKEIKDEIFVDYLGNNCKTKKYENKILGVFLCFLIAVLYIIVLNLLGMGMYLIFKNDEYYSIPGVLTQFLATCFILLPTCLFHLKHIFTHKDTSIFKGFLIAGFYSFLVLMLFYSGYFEVVSTYAKGNDFLSYGKIILFIISMFLVGVSEEWLFRGVILNLLFRFFGRNTKKGIVLSVLFSGIIFGSMHIFNYFSGVSFKGAFFQMMGAIGIGCYFGAIYARTGNIWVLIILHFLNDLLLDLSSGLFGVGSLVESVSNYSSSILVGMLLYLSLAVFLLRPKKLQDIIERNTQ